MRNSRVVGRADRIALLVFIAAFGMSLGVIVALLAEIRDEYNFSTTSLGILTGISFVTAFFSYLAFAPVADRGRARQLMVGAGVIVILSLVAMAFSTELWQWVAARAALGVAQGAIGPAARRVALSWDQGNQGRALGDLVAAGALGFVLGPPIGALLATIWASRSWCPQRYCSSPPPAWPGCNPDPWHRGPTDGPCGNSCDDRG